MSEQLCSGLQKKTLTLEENIRVLDHAEKNPKVGCRKLAELFSVRLTVPDFAKEVDVLEAIRWIKLAWDEVPEEIVQKCLDECGFSSVVPNNERSEEEKDQEFAELVRCISQGVTTAEEYVTADQEIPSCEPPVTTTLPNCWQRLRDEALDLYQKESEEPAIKVVVVAEGDEEDQDVDFEPPVPTIKSTTEAIRLVDDLKEFASTMLQDEILVSKLSSAGQRFEGFKLLHLKQSTITDFFSS